MTKPAKQPGKAIKAGPVELAEDRLDRVAGAAGAYAPLTIKKRIDKATP